MTEYPIDFTNQVVVVTGAAAGIGSEIARALARAGAIIVAVDREETTATQGSYPEGNWFGVQLDLASPEEVAAGCDRIRAKFEQIDALINNAAIYGGLQLTPFENIDLEEWDRVMQVNVRGTYLMTRGLVTGLEAGSGRIVNVASGSALRGSPLLLHYVTSKGGIIAMTRALATELGNRGIRVNAVAPGFVDTSSSRDLGEAYQKIMSTTVEQQAVQIPLQAVDIVGGIMFLASSLNRGITGQTLPIDYGLVKS